MDKILPLINSGHRHFGENKVQETEKKWNEIRYKNDSIKLHLVGKLQSNKAKKAVELFDFIHSLDSTKLADNLQKRENEIKKKPHSRSIEGIKNLAKYRGSTVGRKYVEAFDIVRKTIV